MVPMDATDHATGEKVPVWGGRCFSRVATVSVNAEREESLQMTKQSEEYGGERMYVDSAEPRAATYPSEEQIGVGIALVNSTLRANRWSMEMRR